ncbi:MAG: NUDIX domain-containing protein [Planctomycetota bacterium]|nr:MAG: NUDIX domain-containing protein [Planctomycetota bacterium]
MPRKSAGLLVYRHRAGATEVLLVHPGGPFWARKEEGAWSIPKGEFEDGEDALEAAKREFQEETGMTVAGTFHALAPVRQRSGKIVHAWAVEGDLDAQAIKSNTFTLEWSGKRREYPEVDRAAWFDIEEAKRKILEAQRGLLDQLQDCIARGPASDS